MNTQKELKILENFIINLKSNEEASRTEVELFLQTYMEYIFKLNNMDISKYDITIKKVQIDEYHSKREKQFKNEPNQEKRVLQKRKALTKPSFKANCGNHYFDALMMPDRDVDTKYSILINKNLCHAKNFNEIDRLIYLFYVFGHEVHHIIQYSRFKLDMYYYDYSLDVHDAYYNSFANDKRISPRVARKIKRAINQHLDLIYSCCSSEKHADKKGYDYLDMLFNDILKNLEDKDSSVKNFVETIQELNECIYLDRLDETYAAESRIEEVNQRLSQYIDDEDLLEIN